MRLIVFLLIFILLVITIKFKEKNKSKSFWLKIIVLYFLVIISFNLGSIHIPIGLIVGGLIIYKFSNVNKSFVKLTLIFSLTAYIFAYYVFPPIGINNILYSKNVVENINQFKIINSINIYSEEDPIQKKLRNFYDKETDPSLVMLLAYVLDDKNVSIKNKQWLKYEARQELDLKIAQKIESNNTVYYYLKYNDGTDYLAEFKKENSDFYLKNVIKGKIEFNKPVDQYFWN
ncbi:hypothetical protein [Falsibacillus pallidus]|uniref:Uncharacterized protein n=1 Tax=Falsibacillus pallidus TaxID=493781 RepID=A0A370GWJ5_9BACI|nr:hypothetical protein [Falsibacillus pallidus]RDI48022.1 hypothetical protein DFR59_101691 [Falsibacillus pallidus]